MIIKSEGWSQAWEASGRSQKNRQEDWLASITLPMPSPGTSWPELRSLPHAHPRAPRGGVPAEWGAPELPISGQGPGHGLCPGCPGRWLAHRQAGRPAVTGSVNSTFASWMFPSLGLLTFPEAASVHLPLRPLRSTAGAGHRMLEPRRTKEGGARHQGPWTGGPGGGPCGDQFPPLFTQAGGAPVP